MFERTNIRSVAISIESYSHVLQSIAVLLVLLEMFYVLTIVGARGYYTRQPFKAISLEAINSLIYRAYLV